MSKRVYVSIDIAVKTAQEDTPVSLRIQVSSATVKALHTRLQQAYLKDDVRLVRRTTGLIDLLVHHVPLAVLCERWGGALVKRGQSTLPAFGTLGTFGKCHLPGPLQTDGLPLCSLAQRGALAMSPSHT